jgi:hypothetical protein
VEGEDTAGEAEAEAGAVVQRQAVVEEAPRRMVGTCAADGGGQRRETGRGGRAAAGVAHAAGMGIGVVGARGRGREEREGDKVA